MKKMLADALQKNGYTFSLAQQEQLLHYLHLLQQWNRVFNLTAIDTPQEMIDLHLLDSFTLLPFLTGERRLDVGSGGGLPGIPLAIVDPSKTWVLLDKSQKKTRFLRQVVAELGLKNVTVVCSRCELFQDEAGFDSIVSRAFGTIALLIQGTQQVLRREGYFVAMKGSLPEQELAEIPAGFQVVAVHPVKIQGRILERHIVIVRGLT